MLDFRPLIRFFHSLMQAYSASAVWQIFTVFLRLGLTSFGGPIAHLGYFHHEFVERKKWFSKQEYADLLALCQFLPGPASSQVGMGIGLMRAGYSGLLAAWLGFTLPSALILICFALGALQWQEQLSSGLLHGLKIASVAIVAQAVWGMAKTFCQTARQITLMLTACCVVLLFPQAWLQIVVILGAAVVGLISLPPPQHTTFSQTSVPVSKKAAFICLGLFGALLIGLPLLARAPSSHKIALFDAFYRSGSLVFGGGHVVLPLLQGETVNSGWVSHDIFLAGYALAQTVPGPLFTFAAFLGTADHGILGGVIALLAIFLPSALLVIGTLPFWAVLRQNRQVQQALSGVNAAVVGLLLAALYQPIWLNTVFNAQDFCLALLVWVALQFWTLPVWLVIATAGVIGTIFY